MFSVLPSKFMFSLDQKKEPYTRCFFVKCSISLRKKTEEFFFQKLYNFILILPPPPPFTQKQPLLTSYANDWFYYYFVVCQQKKVRSVLISLTSTSLLKAKKVNPLPPLLCEGLFKFKSIFINFSYFH